MPTFRFAKLVRDKIVAQQLASGAQPQFRQLTDSEHKQALVNKIIEEAQEILHAPADQVAAELADVQQALDDLKTLHKLSSQDIATAQTTKNNKNGSFGQGLYIEQVQVLPDDPWIDYYRKNADRYPEMPE